MGLRMNQDSGLKGGKTIGKEFTRSVPETGRYFGNSPKDKSNMKLGEIEENCVLKAYPK